MGFKGAHPTVEELYLGLGGLLTSIIIQYVSHAMKVMVSEMIHL